MRITKTNPLNRRLIALVVLLAVLPTTATRVVAGTTSHVEDFTTTVYRDNVNTTAWWNVSAGEISYYPFQPTLLDTIDTPTYSHTVVVVGDYAYVGDDTQGLRVIDISDPANLSLVGTYNTPGNAYGLDVVGNYAFVADYQRLRVIDISDPTNPTLAGEGNFNAAYAYNVDVSGNRAYVAYGDYGIRVFDVTDPTAPTHVGFYDTAARTQDVFVRGDRAYVADATSGLLILDVTNPTPTFVGSYDTPGYALDVVVAGDYAFVADGNSGLAVIDVSTPSSPALAGSFSAGGEASGISLGMDYLYLADYYGGLRILDIGDPTNPTLATSMAFAFPANPRDVFVAGENAFLACGNSGLFVAQVQKAVVPRRTELLHWKGGDTVLDGDHLFVFDYPDFDIMDVTDPDHATLIGNYDGFSWTVYEMVVSGDYAYFLTFSDGVITVDISDLTNPVAVDTTAATSSSRDMVIDGNYLYIAGSWGGLDVMDIHDPAHPVLVTNYVTPNTLFSLAVDGDVVYAGGGSLYAIDVSTPASPFQIGVYSPATGALTNVALHGDYALVEGTDGIHVVNISNPASPSLVTVYASTADNIAVAGDYAFMSDPITMLDISNPASPAYLGELESWVGNPGDLYVVGDFLFTDQSQMFRVFDPLYLSDQDVAQSLPVNDMDLTIVSADLQMTQTGTIYWELSADGGANWRSFGSGGGSAFFGSPGNELVWRATLQRSLHRDETSCSQLAIDWWFDVPLVESVADIPADQGRQVRVSWMRSGYDSYGHPSQITRYAVFRKWDESIAGPMPADRAEDPALPAGLPPGEWDLVATVPATSEPRYSVVVPTVVDSTITEGVYFTTFLVSAITANLDHYYSPLDSGYSVDNLAPTSPQNFAVAQNTGSGNTLSWDACPDTDFQHFRIYRSSDPDFVHGPANLVDATTDAAWVDPDFDGWNRYYKVTAVDHSGNESDPASPDAATEVTPPELRTEITLYQNVPNPFNPTTAIRYYVPDATSVTLRIFDPMGKAVRDLVDARVSAGDHEVWWYGLNNQGERVSSGIYFCRLTAGGTVETKKMVLLK